MPALATVTLRKPADWHRFVAMVKPLAGPMAQRGTPLRLVVAEKLATRSAEQHRFMWAAVLDQIAEQACIAGRWFSAETYHEWLKRECLPEVCAKGISKWAHHADGTRSLQMSTTDLNGKEFEDYLLAIQGYAAYTWGVIFTERDEQ